MWLFDLFLSSVLQICYVEVLISRSISKSSLDFEITRVDCMLKKKPFCLSTFTTLWANSADDRLMIFSLFFQKIGFDSSSKLSPSNCQILFLGTNKKNVSKSRMLSKKFTIFWLVLYLVHYSNPQVCVCILHWMYKKKTCNFQWSGKGNVKNHPQSKNILLQWMDSKIN